MTVAPPPAIRRMELPPPTDAAGGSTSGTGNIVQVAPDGKSKVPRGKKIVVSHKKKGEGVKKVKHDMRMSKDRFSAKWLHTIAVNLSTAKRAIIEGKSAFRSLLNMEPFSIPNKLTNFVAGNTTHRLREYKLRKNHMVFTRDMVRKVFGIRYGNKPIDFSNTGGATLDEVWEVYHAGKKRAELATALIS